MLQLKTKRLISLKAEERTRKGRFKYIPSIVYIILVIKKSRDKAIRVINNSKIKDTVVTSLIKELVKQIIIVKDGQTYTILRRFKF